MSICKSKTITLNLRKGNISSNFTARFIRTSEIIFRVHEKRVIDPKGAFIFFKSNDQNKDQQAE